MTIVLQQQVLAGTKKAPTSGALRVPITKNLTGLCMVPKAGLEPAQLSPLPPQDSVSTNSTTWACLKLFVTEGFQSLTLIFFLLLVHLCQLPNRKESLPSLAKDQHRLLFYFLRLPQG